MTTPNAGPYRVRVSDPLNSATYEAASALDAALAFAAQCGALAIEFDPERSKIVFTDWHGTTECDVRFYELCVACDTHQQEPGCGGLCHACDRDEGGCNT